MYLRDYFAGKDEAHHLMAQARDCYLPHFKGNEWTSAGFDAVTKEPTQWGIQLTQPAGRKQPKYMVHLEDAKIVVREVEATGETGKRLMISVKLAGEGEERIARYCSQATEANGLKEADDLGIGWFISHCLTSGRWPEANPNNMLKAFSFRPQYSAVLSEQRFRDHIVKSLPDVHDPDRAIDMQDYINRDLQEVLAYEFRRDYQVYEHLGHLTDDDQPEWEEKHLVYLPDEFECQLIVTVALHLEAWLTVLNTGLHGFDFEGEQLQRMTYEYILGVDCVKQLLKAELPKQVAAEIKELNQLTADAGYWQQRAQSVEGVSIPNIEWRTIENSDGAICTNESGSVKVSVNEDFTVHLAINGTELAWAGRLTPDGFHVREGHWKSDNSIPNLINLKEHPELIRQSFKFGTNEHKALGIVLSFLHWASNQNERPNNNDPAQQSELANAGYWQQRAEEAEAQLEAERKEIESLQEEIDRLRLLMKEASETVYQQQREANDWHERSIGEARALADDALQSLSRASLEEKQLQVVMLWTAGEINTRRACLTLGMTETELGRLKANLITSALGNVFKPMRPLYNWSHKEIPAEATHLTSELDSEGKPIAVLVWKAGEGGMSYRDGAKHLHTIYPKHVGILTDESVCFSLPLETLEARPVERTE